MSRSARALAHPNIALIKYWGKRDIPLNLPAVSSLSVTLDRFLTDTTVTTDHPGEDDHIVINGYRVQATGRLWDPTGTIENCLY